MAAIRDELLLGDTIDAKIGEPLGACFTKDGGLNARSR